MKFTREDFDHIVDLAAADEERRSMRPVIEKEILHFDILYALREEGLLDNLTFQGGTCLRLCYGASRFSEDLDFAGGRDFDGRDLHSIKECIEDHVGARYGLEVVVKEKGGADPGDPSIQIAKWMVSIITAPARRDIPRQRIKLEIANIPAYSRMPRALQGHYSHLPAEYLNLLVLAESLEEILADKLVAFVASSNIIRYRDIWDMLWLQQRGAKPDIDLIDRKLRDYSVEQYSRRARGAAENLGRIVQSPEFSGMCQRFLLPTTRRNTVEKPDFRLYLASAVGEMLNSVADALDPNLPPPAAPGFSL